MFEFGLLHDTTHDLLDGIAPYEIKLLLSFCISNCWFSLDEYNGRLISFNYGYTENDKPIPILSRTLHNLQNH